MKWHRYLLVLLGILLLTGLVALILRLGEPTYKGNTLSEWLESSSSASSDEICQAVLQIGTKGIPTLLGWLQTQNSHFMEEIEAIASKVPLFEFHLTRADHYKAMAIDAFWILQTNAVPAVPELARMLYNTNLDDKTGQAVAVSLAAIGPAGVMVLSQAITNKSPLLRRRVVEGLVALSRPYPKGSLKPTHLSFSRQQAEGIAVDALANGLQDEDVEVRRRSKNGLEWFEDAPTLIHLAQDTNSTVPVLKFVVQAIAQHDIPGIAVPVLTNLMRHNEREVREKAAEMLKNIDPQSAERLSIK